jgi:hypothetical protein
LKSWTEVVVRTPKPILYRNQSQDDSLALFGLEIGQSLLDVAYVDGFAAGLFKQWLQQKL